MEYGRQVGQAAGSARRLATETKSALKTTEFWAFIGVLLALLIAGASIDNGEGTDTLTANEVWLYAAILSFAYMISRGRAKQGSSDPYWADEEEAERAGVARRLVTETKQAFKTTEFWVFVGMLLALLIAGAVNDADDGVDTFPAGDVWLDVIIVTAGYLVGRGLAKAGSRAPYWDEPDDGGPGVADRARAAMETFRGGESETAEGGTAPPTPRR